MAKIILFIFLFIFSFGNLLEAKENYDSVYCFLSFNINLQRSSQDVKKDIETIKRHIKLMQKYNIKADYYWTWPVLKQLLRADPDIVKTIKEAGMDIHHHGANRPPRPQLIDRIKGQNWDEDVGIVQEYETHDIDIQTGEFLSGKGGLSKLKDYFDESFFSTGRFFQSSILYVCKELGAKMAVGLSDNTGASRDDAWFMGILNRPSDFGVGYKAIVNGKTEFVINRIKDLVSQNSKRPLFIAFPIHDHDFFQEDKRSLSLDEQEGIWSNYEEFLSWLAKDSEIKVIPMRDVYKMAIDDRSREINISTINKIAKIISESSDLPEYINLGSDFFSLADSFQAFLEALKYYSKNKSLPEAVYTKDILGPTEYSQGITSPIILKGTDILETANSLTIKDKIPSIISIGGKNINCAEFLVLMAKEISALYEENKIKNIELISVEMIPENALENQKADKLTKLQFWTFKPVRWKR